MEFSAENWEAKLQSNGCGIHHLDRSVPFRCTWCPTAQAEYIAFSQLAFERDPSEVSVVNDEEMKKLRGSSLPAEESQARRRVSVTMPQLAVWAAGLAIEGELENLQVPDVDAVWNRGIMTTESLSRAHVNADTLFKEVERAGLVAVCEKWSKEERFRGFEESFKILLEILQKNKLLKSEQH